MESLANDPSTHFGAALAGWSWPSSVADLASTVMAQGVLSVLMPKGESVSFPMPWDKSEKAEAVSPEVVDEMKARLERFSAFAD